MSTCETESLSLGFTKFSETDVQGSTVEGLDQNFQVGVEAELLICLKTSDGENRNTQHTDRVEVHIDPADQVRSLVTSEKEDGRFLAKFVAEAPGAYEMGIEINEQKLATCPFTIPVKSRKLNIAGKLDLQRAEPKGLAGIAVNSKGVVAVAECKIHCILVFDEAGKFARKLGCSGDKDGQFNEPLDVTFLNDDEILVADHCNHRIQQLNVQSGNFVKSFGKKGSGNGELQNPTSVCNTSDGQFIVVVEHSNSRIQMFTMDGEPVLKFGDCGSERLDHPLGCICHEDKFIVTDKGNNCVKVFDSKGQFLYKFGEKGNGDGELNQPHGLCVDKYGKVVICDSLDNRIQMFTLEGTFIGKTSTNLKLKKPRKETFTGKKSYDLKLKQLWGVTIMPDDRISITEFNGKEIYFLK